MCSAYIFTPREFGRAMSMIKPPCRCFVCVGIRRWAGRVGFDGEVAKWFPTRHAGGRRKRRKRNGSPNHD